MSGVEELNENANGLTPSTVQMLEFHNGLSMAHILSVIAEIGVADQVTDGPLGVEELAKRTGTNADALYRVLRAVASKGVFAEVSPRTFGLTPLAATLRSNVDGSMRDVFRLQGQLCMLDAYAAIGHSVRTGEPAFEHVHGTTLFSYLTARPELSELFSSAMGNSARQIQRPVIDAYDLSDVRRLIDIGGAHGHLVAAILSRYPTMKGVVFDLPHVVPGAAGVLAKAGVADRAEMVGGDYLRAVPAQGDAYTISHVLHQVSDAEAVTVLTNIRKVMAPAGRVLVVDPVIPEGDLPHPGKFMDITMLMLTQGRDRTKAELVDLFEQADLRHVETVALSAPSSIVVAMAA
ncbi:MAG: methyltransferase [Pseudonocardiales bacterium]|nr:methyltransferase [Pseudonocardiales bacterium]